MLRIHCLQQWYGFSGLAMEEALYEIASLRRFPRVAMWPGKRKSLTDFADDLWPIKAKFGLRWNTNSG